MRSCQSARSTAGLRCSARSRSAAMRRRLATSSPPLARADRLLGVDLSYRQTMGMQAIRDLVRSGSLGEIFACDLVFHNAYGPESRRGSTTSASRRRRADRSRGPPRRSPRSGRSIFPTSFPRTDVSTPRGGRSPAQAPRSRTMPRLGSSSRPAHHSDRLLLGPECRTRRRDPGRLPWRERRRRNAQCRRLLL